MPSIADRFPHLAAHRAQTPQLERADSSTLWFPPGRLVELTGGHNAACTTMAVAAVLQTQDEGDTAAWVQARCGGLFPPDLADSGIDLDALVVVNVPESAGRFGIPKAAELLLRSGAFGVVVLDLRSVRLRGDAWLGRLLGLAREHDSRVVLVTAFFAAAAAGAHDACRESSHGSLGSDSPGSLGSLGSLVSLRIAPRRVRAGVSLFAIEQEVLKDKLGAFARLERELRRGPWGLR